MVFWFVGAFGEHGTSEERNYPMTPAHTMFSELERGLRRKDSKMRASAILLARVESEVLKFKPLVKGTLLAHCWTAL